MSFSTKALLAMAASIIVISGSACRGQASLKVGSLAPALQVSRWVKGDGPAILMPGDVYVVEFWATWCPPCKASIPHLTKMANHYKGKVTFIGVSVWEHGSGFSTEEKVNSFVKEMGDNMDYLVARDTSSNTMAVKWLKAAGQNGIPCAFIIDGKGRIAWIGHPMNSMEVAIDRVLSQANK